MAEVVVGSQPSKSHSADERLLASGDEAGTAPGDRPFRPDVEGLRAVAVALVVLFHSQVSAVSGGYVGVDVFFVISGFVITGVLLRERASLGRTSILSFYGRRCRRIIPAATLVIIVTVGMAYWFLGVAGGIPAADDGRWAAVFLANFHFISTGTNYLSSQQPPSPLQNFWSLAVEEQFYVVYPTLFLLVAGARVLSLRVRLAFCLIAIIGVSFAYSVVDTHNNPIDAYFSPFTRGWELALGALVAVCTPWLLKVPARLAALATWLGLGAIVVAACSFTSHTAYPGSLVAIPVVGAALIIAGGMNAHAIGAEALLRLPPFRWLGKLS
jgi:peptidoglycan/LPS O-acetylase OafA/YrhL